MTDEARTAALPAVLQGRYRLGPVIGKGGASVVYRARDQLLGRDVAVKVFTARAADPQELRAQEAEARMLGALSHPGLVTLFDAGIDFTDLESPQVFLVMELVRDFDLRERLRRGPLDPHQVAYIGFDLAGALEYVHEHGIVHRDMKPANVLLFDGGVERPMRAKLADFGIAMLRAQGVLPSEFTTGTAAYLSPEQVEGAELGPETDVYSLGLVLIEAVSGRVVYPGSVVDSALARLDRQPEIPSGVPRPLAAVLASMVERSPSDRPTTAEVAVALREVIVDQIGGRRPAPAPHDAETARLEAVQRYNLVDTPPDGAFDRITSLAARIFDVPIALVTIVDADRIWFKSHYGIDVSETERRRGLSTAGGLHDHTLVIEDIAADPRMGAYPASAATRDLRFYAGVPLLTPDGHNLGSLAILDTRPRPMTDQEVAILEDLAAMVLHEMELRLAARRVVLRRD
ncbi:MAG TPA: protein kinase [Amnibacterium sp.]|jgi:serine/threonine protein kinase|nr:protein kinase [Amnibacterium sp.]